MPGAAHFHAIPSGDDPAVRAEAADRCATLLVRGARDRADEEVVARVVSLADTEGLETLADLWAGSPSDSEHIEAAGDLVAFAVSRKGATITTRTGYVVPSNLEVANSAVFAQPSQQPESSFIFNEGVRRAQPMPFAAAWPQLSDEVEDPLHTMFYAPVIDLDALLEAIDTRSQEILAPEEE